MEGHWEVCAWEMTEGHWKGSVWEPTEDHWQVLDWEPTETHCQVMAWVSATPAAEQTRQASGGPPTLELGLQAGTVQRR